MMTEYTRPIKKYSCSWGSDSAKEIVPGEVACSLSLSVLQKNILMIWYFTRGFSRSISPAGPDHPSTMIYVMKKDAFCGIDTASVLMNLLTSRTSS